MAGGSSGSSRKVGRTKRKGGWPFNGGPARMSKRKAVHHGCGLAGLHGKPADQDHAHKRNSIYNKDYRGKKNVRAG